MKFTVGWQNDELLKKAVMQNLRSISEIYFPWGGFSSGRGVIIGPKTQRKLEADLEEFRDSGLAANLLLNANCYGRNSLSRVFFQEIGDTVSELCERFGLKSVTTTSPIIAKFLKANFPDLETRASVNMEIGNVEGMEYIAQWFDSYYLKREYNWHIEKITEARQWCLKNGKRLYLLANSGCLNFCSAHNFHDNLVAHQHEIAEMDNAYEFHGVCAMFIKKESNAGRLLELSNFIRPEDVPLFENLCDGLKLATRTNRNPSAVVNAYCDGRYIGNIFDITEPSHSIYPKIVANDRIPAEYAKKRLSCKKDCRECGYCAKVQAAATVNLEHM